MKLEAWLHKNTDVLTAVKQGLKQAKQGKGKLLSFNLEDDKSWLEEEEKQVKGRKR